MSEESIRVIIRIRPELNDTPEENDPQNNCLDVHIDRNMIIVNRPKKGPYEFVFSQVLNTDASQYDLYSCCEGALRSVLDGINCCIMAYGQTGSGKTFSMLGKGWEDVENSQEPIASLNLEQEDCGIIPRSVSDLFTLLESRFGSEDLEYSVRKFSVAIKLI